jgi:pyruvate,water dikinase
MELVWLGDVAAHDSRLTGGKAAALSRLAAAFRVPPGFVLTTTAFERSPELTVAILEVAYTRLGHVVGSEAPRVAVRSSAVDEDGAATSFAGQHETYLNLVGVEEVVAAVARCWESARSERALDYRLHHGLDASAPTLAVLVQQLVPADVSAVVFSANPLTGARDEVVINASWGLGESIVGGTTTPDTIVLRRPDLEVIGRTVGEKRRMTVSVPGGTREVEVPALLRSQLAVSDEQIAAMARLAIALEETVGHPVDVECAIAGGELFLLQSRPITTLAR